MTDETRSGSEQEADDAWLVERRKTGVSGLDTLLRGGLVRGAIYLVMGRPGTGKTTLGNQLCFEHVKQGGRAAYMTLLAESHAVMLKNLHTMSFFDPAAINNGLSYVGAYRALRDEKLRGLLDMVRRVILDEKASLLVMDGISPARTLAENDLALKEFVVELQMLSAMTNCTTILLANMTAADANDPEHTMVDGLIELAFEQHRRRTLRTIEVLKFRGTRHLLGRHELDIGSDGVSVHPRMEDVADGSANPAPASDQRLPTGIRQLDTMLRGGVLKGTNSVALGFSGSGKTTLGLHFLNTGAEMNEPGVLFGFYESPARVLQASERVGLKLRDHSEQNKFSHVWQPSYEFGLDRLAARLLAEVQRIGAKRVVIDSLDGFRQAAIDPARTIRFMTALLGELRAREITTIMIDETMKPSGPEMEMRVEGMSALVENLFLLEYMTVGPRMRRLISIVKQRASAHETNAREFFLTARGIEVAPDAASAAEVVAHSDEFSAHHNDRPRAPEAV
jgi:circadian clock protein KaiC